MGHDTYELLVAGSVSSTLCDELRKAGHRLHFARTPDRIVSNLDLVLLGLPDGRSGREWVEAIQRHAGAPWFLIGQDEVVRDGARARQLGASACFRGDDVAQELRVALGPTISARRKEEQLAYTQRREAEEAALSGLLGDSEVIRRLRELLRRVAERADAAPTVLFTGETGSGKGLVAKALHFAGSRRRGPFIDINCAAIPATLIESELFGHARGAYSGATLERKGLFEAAHQGTIFLDEIGSMPLNLQSTLLKVIEDKQVRRIGEREGRAVDVQIFAATHEDLAARSAKGEFRLDLLHRLDVIRVALPPLRERGTDKLVLARAFLEASSRAYGMAQRTFAPDAEEALSAYAFPGNVRELKNIIERASLLESGPVIRAEHLALPRTQTLAVTTGGDAELEVRLPAESFSLEALERVTIVAALAKHGGNVSRTARYLCIGRQKLLYRMRKHGLR